VGQSDVRKRRPWRGQAGDDVCMKAASLDLGFEKPDHLGRAKPLDRIHKIERSSPP